MIACSHPFLQLLFGHYRCLGPGGTYKGESARQQRFATLFSYSYLSMLLGVHSHCLKVAKTFNVDGTYILDACVFLFTDINFALIDSDCVPVTLFEIQELWLSCAESDSTEEESRPAGSNPEQSHSSHTEETGQATQQQPGMIWDQNQAEQLSTNVASVIVCCHPFLQPLFAL